MKTNLKNNFPTLLAKHLRRVWSTFDAYNVLQVKRNRRLTDVPNGRSAFGVVPIEPTYRRRLVLIRKDR